MDTQIRLALPSKGRMGDETLSFLEACGLRVNKTNPRQYTATIPTLPNVLIMFQRPRDIPVSVANGNVDLGITGYDTVAEAVDHKRDDSIYVVHEGMDYGQCRLALAVPNAWDNVKSLDDLRTKAEAEELRVATKYGNAVTRFLEENSVDNVRIVYADGALEAAPSIGYADFIADITSTGTTLRENNMHTIDGGTIVESEAVFIANRESLISNPAVLNIAENMLELMEAYLSARGKYMIFANVRGDTLDDVAQLVLQKNELGGLQFPTISKLGTGDADGTWWSVSIVVKHDRMFNAIQQIREIGGSGVVVTPVSYIFDEKPDRCQRLIDFASEAQATS